MNANLVLLKKDGSHKAFPLPDSVTVIGRRHDCDLRIPLPTVSRKHCQLSLDGDAIELRDLGSTCGTFVNDQRVEVEMTVKAGDYIRIGPLTFVCQIDGKPEQIKPPAKAGAKPQKATAPEEDIADLDASGSFIDLDGLDADELDADLEDLEEA